MRVKGIVEEDFVNYKEPSMFINSCFCDFKCCTEAGLDIGVCQNAPLAQAETKDIPDEIIFQHFTSNPITKAIVVAGMEPFLQADEIKSLIETFRNKGDNSPFVIYTGYYPEEIQNEINTLQNYKNIIIKFGRFIPNQKSHFDEVLGINLASQNQYAMKIS